MPLTPDGSALQSEERYHPPQPDRASALARLDSFVAGAGRDYARFRNYDWGPGRHRFVSRLSPFVRHRLLLEEDVLRAVLQHHGRSASEKFIQEVFWRTYFKGWLEQHPTVWSDYCAKVGTLTTQLELDEDLRRSYTEAVSGRTGIACFDEWVGELVQTGYLHNHARMWFASIWTFTLGLPWQLGADFFYRHLLDGDPASNTLGWRWVCGLHTKGKPYLARAANIARFTGGRFNPAGQLAQRAVVPREDQDPPLAALPPDTASPCAPYGLLLTIEDCHSESLPLRSPPAAITAVLKPKTRSALPVSPAVEAFATGALSDALERANRLWGTAGPIVESLNWSESLVAWAGKFGLATIVTAYAPVGPTASRLAVVRSRLRRQGIELIELKRDFDRLSWPHARQGFFTLNRKIPKILRELKLSEVGD